MRRLHIIRVSLAAFAALVVSGCAPITVTSFTGRNTDPSQYRTYAWDDVDVRVAGDPRLDSNPVFHEAVRGAIERHLARRGYEQTAVEADLLVRYRTTAFQRIDVTPTESASAACSDCTTHVYDAGSLVIDLIEARTRTLVWHGIAEAAIGGAIYDQADMEERIERIVSRTLATLPPHLDVPAPKGES